MPFVTTNTDFGAEASEQVREAASFSHGHAHQAMTFLIPMPLLANSDDEPLPCYEPPEETAAVSAHVSKSIHAYYKQLTAYFANLESPPERFDLRLTFDRQDFDNKPDECYHRNFHSRRLLLENANTLPDLPVVTRFTFDSRKHYAGFDESEDRRPFSIVVPLQLLVHLPRVQEFYGPWLWERPMPAVMPSKPFREHLSWPFEGSLRDARHEFGAAILDQEKYLCGRRIPASLTKATMYFWETSSFPHEDQSIARPNLIHPAEKDPVSVGLSKLGTQLHVFNVRALVTLDIFPPPDAPTEQQWSQMRHFRLELHPLRPDGRWYFVGARGEDPHDSEQGGYKVSDDPGGKHYPHQLEEEEDDDVHMQLFLDPPGEPEARPDMFRTQPCRDRVEPLLVAFAKALTKMPSLKDAEVFTYLAWSPSDERGEEYGLDTSKFISEQHRWGVKYIAAVEDGEMGTKTPVVQWQVGDWRPSQEVMSVFESLGSQQWLDLEVDKQRSVKEPEYLSLV